MLSLIAALVRAIESALSARERLGKRKGGSGGRGGQEGRTYSQRAQLEAQHARGRGDPLRPRCFGSASARATARERQSQNGCAWCGLVRGKGGEGAAVGASRGSTMATAAAASGAGARLGGAAARGPASVWRERCGSGGFASSRRHGGTGRAARGAHWWRGAAGRAREGAEKPGLTNMKT